MIPRTLVSNGIDVCFANPGTTELPFVTGLDETPGLRSVLGLFEGVCTGAADGYFRITGRPAATLLHLGPGLANGLANLHNARRAGSGVVNLVGDHLTDHLQYDPPLASDIRALAETVGEFRATSSPQDAVESVTWACAVAHGSNGIGARVATVGLHVDHQSGVATDATLTSRVQTTTAQLDGDEAVAGAISALESAGERGLLYLTGRGLTKAALIAAARVSRRTGCHVLTDVFSATIVRGSSVPGFRAMPYFPDRARERLQAISTAVLVGGSEPVNMFGEAGVPSLPLPPHALRVTLSGADEDAEGRLVELAERLGAPAWAAEPRPAATPSEGPLDPRTAAQAVCALLPEGSVVVNEAGSNVGSYLRAASSAAEHAALTTSGGAIGMGLPASLGAAIGAPGRAVVTFQADGSALYTLQALWSMARESLNVTVVLFVNGTYEILRSEIERGAAHVGALPAARDLTSLDGPAIDWSAVARGLGAETAQPSSVAEFVAAFEQAVRTPGPNVILVRC